MLKESGEYKVYVYGHTGPEQWTAPNLAQRFPDDKAAIAEMPQVARKELWELYDRYGRDNVACTIKEGERAVGFFSLCREGFYEETSARQILRAAA